MNLGTSDLPSATGFDPVKFRKGKDLGGVEANTLASSELLYRLLVAEIAGQRGNLNIATEEYLNAANISKNPSVAERATRIASFARNDKQALAAAERWVALAPKNLDARQSLALLYLREKRVDDALAQLNKVQEQTKDTEFEGFTRIAGLLSRESDIDAVFQVMDKLVAQHDKNVNAYYAYSSLALQLEKLDKALQAVDKALVIDPGHDPSSVLRATVLMAQGKADEALASMAQVVTAHPKSKKHIMSYARLLAEAKRYNQAREQFEKLLKSSPEDPELLYALALLSMEAKQLDLAENYFKRVLKTGKRLDETHFYLGAIAEDRRRYDQAVQWFAKVSHGERQIDARIRIAGLMGKKGDVEAARRLLYQMQSDDPELAVRLYIAEADILRHAKRYKDAMEVLNNALQQIPDNNDIYYARSLLAEKLDRLDIVEADLKRVLANEPDNAHALNALGYTLADRTTRYQEALQYIKRAIDISPDQPAFVDSMGWVQYRLGNLEEAERYLRRAYELDQDAEIAAHLGEVLWNKGNKKEAKDIWNRALKIDPENDILIEVMQRFNVKP